MAAETTQQAGRYPAYQPTGVEWMPEIPAGWEVKKLKFVATINPSRDTAKLDECADSVVFLPMEAVGEDGSFRQDTFKSLTDVVSGYTYFEQDDVLLAKITPCFENGKATILTELATPVGFGSTEFHVLRPKQNSTISRFLFYIIKSELFLRLGEGMMVGSAGQKRVPTDFLADFQLAIPSIEEQEAIVRFLDDKTVQIDQLITQKQQMLELLREERAALINHAVTKGLDAAAPLRDSGVEWLGEVPAHWEVKRLKRVVKSLNYKRIPLSSEERGKMTVREYDYYGASGVIDQVENYLFDDTLILIGEDGANLLSRSTRLAFIASGKFWVNNHAHILDPVENNVLYLSEMLEGIDYSIYVTGSAQPKLTQEALLEVIVPCPPVHEQNEIANYLQQENNHINETTATINQEIALLQEYRAALIAEAVTGQIDVRHHAPAAAVLM